MYIKLFDGFCYGVVLDVSAEPGMFLDGAFQSRICDSGIKCVLLGLRIYNC